MSLVISNIEAFERFYAFFYPDLPYSSAACFCATNESSYCAHAYKLVLPRYLIVPYFSSVQYIAHHSCALIYSSVIIARSFGTWPRLVLTRTFCENVSSVRAGLTTCSWCVPFFYLNLHRVSLPVFDAPIRCTVISRLIIVLHCDAPSCMRIWPIIDTMASVHVSLILRHHTADYCYIRTSTLVDTRFSQQWPYQHSLLPCLWLGHELIGWSASPIVSCYHLLDFCIKRYLDRPHWQLHAIVSCTCSCNDPLIGLNDSSILSSVGLVCAHLVLLIPVLLWYSTGLLYSHQSSRPSFALVLELIDTVPCAVLSWKIEWVYLLVDIEAIYLITFFTLLICSLPYCASCVLPRFIVSVSSSVQLSAHICGLFWTILART